MDIRQFRHFAAVAESLQLGGAAERLGMTQPPLSQSILALEKELGAPLFARTKRSVELTPLGQQWLPHVLDALAAVDALPETARRLRDGQTGYLTLSFVSTADYSVLPDLVRRYAEAYPGVEIRLVEATSDVQIPAVVAGERHAGIIIPPAERALPEALAYHRLVSPPLGAAVPPLWGGGPVACRSWAGCSRPRPCWTRRWCCFRAPSPRPSTTWLPAISAPAAARRGGARGGPATRGDSAR